MSHPRFFFLAVPALAAAALLFAGGAVSAAPKGGSSAHSGAVHGGAGHGGAAHGGAAHGGAVHGGAVHVSGGAVRGGGFYRGYGYGYGVGIYLGGFPGYGYGYGYPSYDDYYSPGYAVPPAASYSVMPPAGDGSTFSPPADTQPATKGSQEPIAHIRVVVPADAEVWFGQGKTGQTGAVREFVSPALTPGKEYVYEVKARWMQGDKEVVQTRQVDVGAGSWTVVDFTKAPAEKLDPPKPKP